MILQADWYPQPEHGGFFTALAKGYYKEEGLDVTIQPLGPYLSVEKQVSSGAAQFGMGSSDRTLEAIADGQPLVAVAATMQNDPQGVMVRKDSPIHSFADLNGHTVAIKNGIDVVGIHREALPAEQRARSSGDDERGEFRGRSAVRAAGVCDFRAVFRAEGGDRNARAADERRGIQPVSRDVHDAGVSRSSIRRWWESSCARRCAAGANI